MKYSYNWLKELSETKKTAEEIAEMITMHSFEVEAVEKTGSDFAGVLVGKIMEIRKHPNADKLQLTKVTIGGKTDLDIVCGAQNISVGDHVPVATVGTKLPTGIEIREAEIRGEKSVGMLCALDELGLGTDHSGILLLDKKTKIGTPFAKVLGESDFALDIKILPDRAHDALSHVSMAREISALEGTQMDYDYSGLVLPKKKTQKLSVKIDDSEKCARYIGAVMHNIKVAESPLWLRQRLETCGIRAINNVVDATNYVMLELGQPLHAFDLDVIGRSIIVRQARKQEKIELLDGGVKELDGGDIVIANESEALALAGIMGGSRSGISEKTVSLVLEAANFKAVSVRKTRSRLNLFTESSSRFEKEIDPNLAEKAMVRLIEILEHIAGAQLEGSVDIYPKKSKAWSVRLDVSYAQKLLGTAVPTATIVKILSSLGIEVALKDNIITAEVPTFRIDLKTAEDLIEEIGRLYGYEKISAVAPLVLVKAAKQNENRTFERTLKNILLGQGFSEVYNYSFYGEREARLAGLGADKHLELALPMSSEHTILRTSLIPNMLKNIKENSKSFKEFSIFELGRVYWKNGEVLPKEKTMLAGAVMLERKNSHAQAQDKRHASSFFEIKSHIDQLLAQIGITDHYYDNFHKDSLEAPHSLWHESRSAEIKILGQDEIIGYLGELNPLVLANFDIHTRVAMFELDLANLLKISEAEREYAPIRKHPVVTRDLSMLASEAVRVDDILQVVQEVGGNLILDVDLFDAMDFADNTTSFAFHIFLGADDRTLTGKEIDEVINLIIMELEKQLGLKVRK